MNCAMIDDALVGGTGSIQILAALTVGDRGKRGERIVWVIHQNIEIAVGAILNVVGHYDMTAAEFLTHGDQGIVG